jgi:hypothetical protein
MPALHDRVRVHGVPLGGRVHSAFARDRLARALHEIAIDALHPAATMSRNDAARLRDSLARPIRVASEAALGTLAAELERALVDQDIVPAATESTDG